MHPLFMTKLIGKLLLSPALQTPAWVALPLVILIVAGGLYIYKRKRNKDPGTECASEITTKQQLQHELL